MLVLALTAAWIPVQRASAKTYVVLPEGGGDFPTIQDAVDASVDNDVIELGNGIFDGLGNTNVFIADKLITIRSQSDDPNQCIIDCNARGDAIRGFSVVSGDNIGPLIQGITVREGLAGLGGAIQTNGALRLTNCKFLDNESNVGGAVHTLFPDSPRSAGGGSIVIDGCDFIGNLANTQGGAIAYVNPSFSLTIMNCRFFRNQSRFGGAIFSTTGSPQISGSIFAENRAAVQGGAIVCITGAAISNCTFALNGAPAGGGAIFYGSPDPTTGFPSAGFILSVSNSIIAFSQGSHPVSCEDTALMEFLCCDIYGNAAGDWVGCLTGLDTENGNISQNPLFCGLEFADLQLFGDRFTLAPKSPCLPSKNCELIGARGQEDCIPQPGSGGSTGAEDLESATWGRIKSTYR
jgi:predicted outer membrane repeat protein